MTPEKIYIIKCAPGCGFWNESDVVYRWDNNTEYIRRDIHDKAIAAERERAAGIIDEEIKEAINNMEASTFIEWLEGIAKAIRGDSE